MSSRLGRLSRFGILIAAGAASAAGCSNDPVKVKVADTSTGLLNAGPSSGLVDDDPTAQVDAACVTATTAAEQRQVSLYMMLDSSGSMLETTGTIRNKWDSVVRAIRGFMQETSSSDLQIGLQFFPLAKPGAHFSCKTEEDCGPDSDNDGVADGGPCFLKTCQQGSQITLCTSNADCPGGALANPCVEFGLCSNSDPTAPLACLLSNGSGLCGNGLGTCQDFDRTCTNATQCTSSFYEKPAVEIGLVSQNLGSIDQALTAQTPQGLTPTAPALQGAIDHARAWGKAHPDQTVVTLLATDGLPTECGKDQTTDGIQPLDEVLSIAASGLTSDIPVRTFVIGVFQPGDGTSINNVNRIAEAGGTDSAVFIDTTADVDQQFLDALRAIRSGQLACEFQVPTSDAALDYLKVNLQFNNGTTASQLTYVRDGAGCDATPGGWHYNVDPTQTKPTAIQVCPAVCNQFKQATSGSIQVQLGCSTIIR
jgi:hypothetical protein